MKNSEFWRNSTQKRSNLFWIVLKYILLIPFTPLATFFVLMPRRRYGSTSDHNHITDEIIAAPTLFLIVTLSIGILAWLWTIKAQCKPVFEIDDKGIKYCAYGFFYSHISFGSVKSIKPYRIFPFGTLIDMQSNIGSNVRFFAFIARVKKPELREFLKSTNVEVI